MKKEPRDYKLVITSDNEVYRTLNGKRLTSDQVKMYEEYLEKEKLMDIIGEDSKKDTTKEKTNDALWAIADDMRERKREGEFDSFKEAKNELPKKRVVVRLSGKFKKKQIYIV